jgi:hypothetical protein
LLSFGWSCTRSFSFCCMSSGSGCCDFLVPAGAAAGLRALKASDGAGGGAIGLARASRAELGAEEAIVADVDVDADAADGSLPARAFGLGDSQ